MTRKILFLFCSGLIIAFLSGCKPPDPPQPDITVDRDQLLEDIRILSSDEFEGRFPGTRGSYLAQDYIIDRFEALGLLPMTEDGYRQYFSFTYPEVDGERIEAANIIGAIQGSCYPFRFIVVSAHYDHLGIIDGEIYNGADDNASGVGGMLAAAAWFSRHPPRNSILFIAFDVEEIRKLGAYHFMDNPVVPVASIVMNINLDMISLNHFNEIYAAGTYHYPFLKPIIESATLDAPVNVLFGHDSPDLDPWDDWTFWGDHAAFHEKGIPFICFAVEDHPYYHTPDDTFENITPDFYYDATRTIIGVIREFDLRLDEVIGQSYIRVSGASVMNE